MRLFRLMNHSLKSFSQIGGSLCGEELLKERLPTELHPSQSMEEALIWEVGAFSKCKVGGLHWSIGTRLVGERFVLM